MDKFCYGCGYDLQTNNQDQLGYINEIKVTDDPQYCKRCYNMIFQNETPKVFLKNEDYWELFDYIVKKNQLYVLVIDIFNIEGSLISDMLDKLKDKNIVIALNKRDLLPKLVSDKKIYTYIKSHPKLKDVKVLDLLVVSAKNKYNIDMLLDLINFNRQGDVYLVGLANVGKSSLINALINSVLSESKKYISTSYYGGTTLGLINIPFGDGYDLIDTPGIVSNQQLVFNNNNKILKAIVPTKEIRPKSYQLNEKQTIFVTGFMQLDYISGHNQGFTIYCANQIKPHRTHLDNSKVFREKHLGEDIIIPPYKEDLENLDFTTKRVKLIGKNVDIVVDEICFINLKNISEEIVVEITIPKDFNFHIRRGLI